MKPFYLLTIALVLNSICYSQNWQPFPNDLKKWFEFDNEDHYSVSLYYPDSLETKEDSTHYYFHLKHVEDQFKSLNPSGTSCLSEPLASGSDETWLDRLESKTQDFVSIKHPYTEVDGQYFYKGQLVFDTNLGFGQGIRLYSDLYEGISELRITYVQFGLMDVLGVQDSFKLFQLRPVLDNPLVPHPYSNYQYVLSKSFGFIEFMPFMELFDAPKTSATLVGYEDENGNIIGDVPNFKPNYEAGDVIEHKRELDDFSNTTEFTLTRDSIIAVDMYGANLTYTYNRREIRGEVNMLQPPPGVYYPDNPSDTTFYTNQQQQISLEASFADFYNSIYNSNLTINTTAELLHFSFTDNEQSSNVTTSDFLGALEIPSAQNCFSKPLPFLSQSTSIYNSELGLINNTFYAEAGFTETICLISYTKSEKAYTPFTQLEDFYDISDTLILLKNEYHPLANLSFEGPGVEGQFFNPAAVPDSLINQPFDITISFGLWTETQTVIARTPDFCPCEDEPIEPVCGENAVNYDNACFARCDGVEVAFEGSCDLATCDTPLQLPFVQNAINEGCAELIHTATDNGRTYISVNKNCEGEGLIYDCTNGSICTYTDYETLNNCETDVPLNFNVLLGFYYDLDNIIWSKPCNYEYEGIVEYDWFACGPACDAIIYYVILNNGSRIYPYQQGLIQGYEGRYVKFSLAETANLDLSIGYGNTVPSQHITCLEPISVEPCLCSRWYEPVCSVDGKTYLNSCIAECAGVEIEKEEACENQICIDPLELEIVQDAIISGCTEIIYQTLSYGTPYIVIDKNCENETVVYDCNSGEICTTNSANNNCDIPINLNFNFDDVIWSTPCTYEYEGYVRNEFYSCGPYCSGIRYFIVLNDGSRIYPLQGLQSYWGRYIKFSRTETTNIFSETEEGGPLPLYYITCFEPLNEESCTCEFDYIPVCGTDGTTYLNSCIAECIDISVEQAGKCDCTPPPVGEFSCE